MKLSSLACLSLPALAFTLVGCATAPSMVGSSNEIDYAKVGAIERAAQRNGVNVYWLNYPLKRQTITSATPSGS